MPEFPAYSDPELPAALSLSEHFLLTVVSPDAQNHVSIFLEEHEIKMIQECIWLQAGLDRNSHNVYCDRRLVRNE